MGAPLPELVPEGPIAAGTPFRLYYLAAATGGSGLLTLDDPIGVRFELGFKKGVPELARCNDPALELLSWMAGQGVLDEQALSRARVAGGDPVAALFSLGLLGANDAFARIGAHGRAVLARALLLEAGTFAWKAGETLPAGGFPLGAKWGLLLDAVRQLDEALACDRLGDAIDRPVMKAGDGLVALEALGLNAHELRAVHAFDGTRSLAMLAAASPAEAATIYRTGWALAEMGLASFARTLLARPPSARVFGQRAERRTPGPAPRPAPARPGMRTPGPSMRTPGLAMRTPGLASAGSPPAAGASIRFPTDLDGVAKFLASLEGKNHFEVLGLPRSATLAHVKQAYFQRAKAFHPDTAGGANAELVKAKEAITARLNEAYAVLGDDASRAAYAAALAAGASAAKVDVANLLAAEQTFRKAQLLGRARRWAEALAELDQAIALNPDEGEFYAWRGFARFSAALDKRAARVEAFADLERALRLNDRCVAAFLFAGRIHTVLGDADRAIKYYRRCLALDAGNVEAQRELRLLESRSSR